MYIRTVFKKNKNSAKRCEYQQLVETIRTDQGVQQKLLLSLGRLSITKERWPRLANRIEAILRNQQTLIPEARDIEELAQRGCHPIAVSPIALLQKRATHYLSVNVPNRRIFIR